MSEIIEPYVQDGPRTEQEPTQQPAHPAHVPLHALQSAIADIDTIPTHLRAWLISALTYARSLL